MLKERKGATLVVMGDYNMPGHMPEHADEYQLWTDNHFTSTCMLLHGNEFEVTWPSGIQAEHMDGVDA